MPHNAVRIDLTQIDASILVTQTGLSSSLTTWQQNGIAAVWVDVPIEAVEEYLPILLRTGFRYHHAEVHPASPYPFMV